MKKATERDVCITFGVARVIWITPSVPAELGARARYSAQHEGDLPVDLCA